MNIVLFEPEIPANTGNIGRTCVATGTKLHLIGPLGFKINEKSIQRAGLDYWHKLDVIIYDSFNDFLNKNPEVLPTRIGESKSFNKLYMATTKALNTYTDIRYESDCYIMFGKESAGIPENILIDNPDNSMRIPMIGEIRSLNLANSVAIVLYEALRQNGFCGMQLEGELHRFKW